MKKTKTFTLQDYFDMSCQIDKGEVANRGWSVEGRNLQRTPRPLPGVNFASEDSINQFLLRAFPRLNSINASNRRLWRDEKYLAQVNLWRETIRLYFQFGWSERETAEELQEYFGLPHITYKEPTSYKKMVGGTKVVSFAPARIGGMYKVRKFKTRVGGKAVAVKTTSERTLVKDIVKKIRRVANGLRRDGKERTPASITKQAA